MPRGNGERVSRCADGGPKAADTTVTKVVRADVNRIVYLVVGDAFDVTGPIEISIDRHGVTTRRAAGVTEVERLVIVGSGETTTRTGLAAAGARARVPADAVLLRRITRHELAGRDRLGRTAGAGWNGEWNGL